MNITYDPDALYHKIKKRTVSRTREADENTILNYDEHSNVISIKLLFVKEHNPSLLKDTPPSKTPTPPKPPIM